MWYEQFISDYYNKRFVCERKEGGPSKLLMYMAQNVMLYCCNRGHYILHKLM